MDVINPPAAVQQSDEQQLITTARDAQAGIEAGKWTIGRAAHEWCQRYANGRTDADFARLADLEADAVQRYRNTYATFGDVRESQPFVNLKWSHFYFAIAWDDAEDWLGQASEHGWTVAEMKRMRSIQDRIGKGDDLTTDSEGEAVMDDDDGMDAASPEHVGDVDPYQKPGTIVVPTPRDKRDERPSGNGADRQRTLTDTGSTEVDEHNPQYRRRASDNRCDGQSEDGAGSNLERVLDTVRSLIDALKPTLTGMEPHTLAEQFRRIADEIERDAE